MSSTYQDAEHAGRSPHWTPSFARLMLTSDLGLYERGMSMSFRDAAERAADTILLARSMAEVAGHDTLWWTDVESAYMQVAVDPISAEVMREFAEKATPAQHDALRRATRAIREAFALQMTAVGVTLMREIGPLLAIIDTVSLQAAENEGCSQADALRRMIAAVERWDAPDG